MALTKLQCLIELGVYLLKLLMHILQSQKRLRTRRFSEDQVTPYITFRKDTSRTTAVAA